MLGYVFFPLAYMMGITEPSETFCVAQLMGTKTALNEFIAYKQLGQMVEQRKLSVSYYLTWFSSASICSPVPP
jgi:nucleoside permease NupC